MSPANTPRQLLIWSLPTVAVLLSFLWYKRRKNSVRCDIGDIDPSTSTRLSEPAAPTKLPDHQEVVVSSSPPPENVSPARPITFSRSLSGVDSAPIDIKSARSAPLVISDTELDLEIEKIKSMKAGASIKKTMAASPLKKKSQKAANKVATSVTPVKSNVGSGTTSVDVDEELLHQRGRSTDRDSANHSPADVMMPASPTLSSISDNNPSDSDSGKGGSDVATPPPVQQQEQQNIEEEEAASSSLPSVDPSEIIIYEFVIPQQLVGRLIGRHGAFVHQIKEKTNARILIKKHPDPSSKLKVCAVEGTTAEVDAAIAIVRDKFPAKRYAELSLERVSFVPVVPDCMYLRLIEGVNNDTIVSCVSTPAHLFLQQPTHPTFPSLNVLTDYMNVCYSESTCQAPPPTLPAPVLPGTICAAQSQDIWYRVSVSASDDDAAIADVLFLDFGGYASLPYTSLRQIRGDFLLLPFQAAECFLANVEPVEEEWSPEAYDTVVELTRGAVVLTQVVDYLEEDGVTPFVHIYVRSPERGSVVMLNRELAERGFARWTDGVCR